MSVIVSDRIVLHKWPVEHSVSGCISRMIHQSFSEQFCMRKMGGFSHIRLGVAVARSMHFRSRVNGGELNALHPTITGMRSTKLAASTLQQRDKGKVLEECRWCGWPVSWCLQLLDGDFLLSMLAVTQSVKEFIFLYLFIHLPTLSVFRTMNNRMIGEWEAGNNVEGSACGLNDELSWHFVQALSKATKSVIQSNL
jgi:hypothetical protein